MQFSFFRISLIASYKSQKKTWIEKKPGKKFIDIFDTQFRKNYV